MESCVRFDSSACGESPGSGPKVKGNGEGKTYRDFSLDRVDVDLLRRVREVGIEAEHIVIANLLPCRILLQHPLLAARQTLERSLQLSVV